MTALPDAALSYAARGWLVFPVKTRDKTPLTSHGVKDACADAKQIRRWWETWPDANIGLACGPSGLVIVDLDAKSGGLDTWAELRRVYSIDDSTVTSLTGGGGQHLIFKSPAGVDIRNSAGKLGPGVDVRANGGYIVIPPSIHPSGRAYVWEANGHPDDMEPAPLPDALLRLLQEPPEKTAPPVGDSIANGTRNATLTSLAGTMRKRGMTRGAIEAALLAENAVYPTPATFNPGQISAISVAQN